MLSFVLTGLGALTLAVWVVGGVAAIRGGLSIRFLRDVAPLAAGAAAPFVSVVVAARDEAHTLEPALRSLLRQRYARLEVIVVDDRSRDGTGALLDRRAREHAPRLRVLHLHALPDGWLGKNHALQRGAALARGELLLFTDADVLMQPTTVARAVAYLERERLDHVAVAPELRMPGLLLELFAGTFALFFSQYARPWKARDPKSRAHVGIGAFNLLRASAYHAAGAHRPIALRPDDDMMLGKLLKRHGARQDVLFGRSLIAVQWYASLGEAVRGLEKNTFAGLGYSLGAVLAASAALLLLNVWPFLALVLTRGAAWALNAATVAVVLLLFAGSSRASGARPWLGVAFPLGSLLFVYIVVRAAVLALRRGGIRWRDTHYPLHALRANRL